MQSNSDVLPWKHYRGHKLADRAAIHCRDLNATKNTAGTTVLTVIELVLVVSCAINGVTASSRQLWYRISVSLLRITTDGS